jgi:hypothetical protein
MMMEELQSVETPVSDFSAGLAAGIGIGLAIVGIALCC